MAIKAKKRNEINDKYKWDLTSFYKNDEEFNQDKTEVKKLCAKVCSYKGHLCEKAETLLSFLLDERKLSLLLHRLTIYVTLKKDEDCNVSKSNEDYSEVFNLLTDVNEKTSFVNPELLEQDFSLIKKFIAENKALEEFAFMLERIYREKSHILSKEKEEMLVRFSDIAVGFSKSYNFIKNSQLDYGTFKDENNELVELTDSNYRTYMRSANRRVRRTVNKLYNEQYKKNNLIIAENLIGFYKYENFEAEIRKYKSALDYSLFYNKIDENIYHNLIKTINENISVMGKYYQLVKKITGVKKLYDYDLSVKLVNNVEKEYPYEKAQEIIKKGLGVLGKDYIDFLSKAFQEKWIDVFPNKGKHSGFYNMPNYISHQFILANYENKYADVSALAHELGHAVNFYLSVHKNPFQYYRNSVFLAEVASLTNEILLAKFMLINSRDKDEKLNILNHMLRLYTSNLFGATKGANFELIVHKKLQEKETITNETLNDIWKDLLTLSYKDEVNLTDYSKYGWSVVPHFYYNYYYYQYATGISMATYIANKIESGDAIFLEKYLEFLKKGSTNYPLNIISELGIDMKKSDTVLSAIKTFDELIDLFYKIYKE